MIRNNIITATKVQQNNQEFLVAIFSISTLFTFTRYTERIIDFFDDNNVPQYNNRVQRKIEIHRVDKIADFLIDDPDAIFPTNIVLAIPSAAIEKMENLNDRQVEIHLDKKVFKEIEKQNGDVYLTIIDGQHRIRGIERAIERLNIEIKELARIALSSENENFEKRLKRKTKQLKDLKNICLIVSFFIDPTLEFQAMIFSTINRTQKTVPQSLVSSLFGLTEKDSPFKTALEVVLALNGFSGSPFYNRIKLHGGEYERNQSPPLTQAAMVKSLVDLISSNQRELERDRHRERRELLQNCTPDKPFRIYYANNRDSFITDILFSFFSAVKETFVTDGVEAWEFEENTKPVNVLQTTVGYQALLNILVDILAIEKTDEKRDKVSTYSEYLTKAKSIDVYDIYRYPFTSKTKKIFYYDLSLKIWPAVNNEDIRIRQLNLTLRGI